MGELIVNGIKWTFIISLSLVFMTALHNLLSLITLSIFSNVIGDVMHVISCCLPFNASAVFGAIETSMSAILTFLIAQKIYNLTSQHITI